MKGVWEVQEVRGIPHSGHHWAIFAADLSTSIYFHTFCHTFCPRRYGENPHQKAAFYKDQSLREASAGGVATSIVHWGKEMSYNNYLVGAVMSFCSVSFRGGLGRV